MDKLNLIIISGFGPDEHVMNPAIDVFREYFNVYYFDLPGFGKDEAISDYSMENLTTYFQDKINNLDLKQYILGSLSFGFAIINHLKIGKSCKGVLAYEPYINGEFVKLPKIYKKIYLYSLSVITFSRLYCFSKIYKAIFKKILEKHYPKEFLEWVDRLDIVVLLQTAKLLLSFNDHYNFHNLPHAMIINQDDSLIDAKKTIEYFRERISELFIMESKLSHFPRELKEDSIKRGLDKNDLDKLIMFLKRSLHKTGSNIVH